MSDEPRDRAPGSEPHPTDQPDRPDRPDEAKPDPGRSGRPPAGDRPPAGRPYGERPPGNRPYGSKPPGRPYPARSAGRPDDRPYGGGDRPRRDAPPGERRPLDSPGRRVDYSHRDRRDRPPGQRGSWTRDPAPRGPRGDWDRRDRPAPTRPSGGPVPAEVLAADEEIVAGRRPVEEAFAARREAKRLLVVPERRAALDRLVLHATTLRIPVVEVEGGTITAVSGFDGHQGIALVVAPRRWATLDEVLALAKSRNEPPFLLALDHLEDPQNVGTLLRSAEACGVHGVDLPHARSRAHQSRRHQDLGGSRRAPVAGAVA